MFNGMNGLEILKNWPRYEDGEPVRFGDEIHVENERPYPNFNIVVDRISFDKAGFIELFDDSNSEVEYRSGERIKRRVWASNELEAKLRSRERKIERLKKQLGYAEAKNAERRAGAKWLKEHGGLCAVRRRVRNADNRLIELCDALDVFVDDAWNDVMAELRKRLMPEGMEWPRDESGEPVQPSDKLLDKDGDWFKAVSFVFTCDWWSVRGYQTEGFGDLNNETRRKLEGMAYGTCVKRPAPKVLDAEGTDIREKCDVWWICEGDERGVHAERLRVETICPDGLIECSPYNGGTWVYLEPSELYVNKPVPSSDGKPLREGETVYKLDDDRPYTLKRFDGDHVYINAGGSSFDIWTFPNKLTHERPESKCRDCAHWQKDPTADNMGVCWFFYHEHEGQDCYPARRADIGACEEFMPRAKALEGDA